MDNTSHLCAKAMLENLLQSLFGKNYDMGVIMAQNKTPERGL
jgi:hypothetical protein